MLRIDNTIAIVLITVSVITFFSLFGTAYGEFKVEKENYDISYSGTTYVKMFGTLEDSDSLRNKVTFAITNPKGDSEEISVIPTNRGYFENLLIYDRNSLLGIYEVIAYTYDGRTIGKVSFELHKEKKSVDVATKQPEVPSQKLTTIETKQSIPSWIRTLAGFWINDQVSDSEFISALEFMITNGIIQVSKEDPMVNELQDENKKLKTEIEVLRSLLSSQPTTQESEKKDFKEYDEWRYYFKYPADWHGELASNYAEYGTDFRLGLYSGSYYISEKLGSEGAKIKSVIDTKNVDIQDMLINFPEGYSKTCENRYGPPDDSYSCKKHTLLKSERITVDDKPAYHISYTETRHMENEEDDYQFTSWKFWIFDKYGGSWSFSYDVVGEDIDRHHKIVNDIISSMILTSRLTQAAIEQN